MSQIQMGNLQSVRAKTSTTNQPPHASCRRLIIHSARLLSVLLNPTMPFSLRDIGNYVCRGCLLVYSVLALASIPFTLRLLGGDWSYDSDSGVVTIPLTVCMPNEVSAIGSSGTSVAFEVDTADGYACKDASVLVFATVVSAGISAIAALIYLYKDVRSLPEKGTLNMSFLLLQAGLVTASLLREVYFWQKAYQTAYDSMGQDYTVRFPSSMALPTVSCAFAFASILVLALRKGYIVFFGGKTDEELPIAQSVTAKVSTKLPSLNNKTEVPVAEPVTVDSGTPEWAKV